MSDKPTRVIDEDGSIYAAEIVPPEGDTYGAKYHVDLVRASVDEYGLGREQRLTVGQYSSWGEAEEHLHAVEDDLTEHGLAALGESAQQLREQPYGDDIFYLTAVYPPDGPAEADHAAHLLAIGPDRLDSAPLTPPVDYAEAGLVRDRIDGAFAGEGLDTGLIAAREEAERSGARSLGTPLFDADDGAVRHIDGGGTAHWFAIAEKDDPAEAEPYELRYYRALETADGAHLADSYAVMPLPDDDPGSAWPMPGLEAHLQQGDVFMAQMLAHNVADAYGQTFPEPAQLPALDPRPEYYFGYGVGPNGAPSLEAVKTWMDGAERRFDTLTISEHDSYEDAAADEYLLETTRIVGGVEQALNVAERWSADNGYLDPQRDDPRIFFTDDAPPDAFTTHRARELEPDHTALYREAAEAAEREREASAALEGAAWFEATFARSDAELLQPVDDTVNYAVVVQDADPWTVELAVEKVWKGADGYVGVDSVTLDTYDSQSEYGREQALADRAFLLETYADNGLQALMHHAEATAVANGHLAPDRDDPRLFTDGPPDRFETLRENPSLGVSRGAVDIPHWRFDTLPVNDPDGEPLGQSLHMVVYPNLEHDPESPAISRDEPFHVLEVAHFETDEAAEKFIADFNGYLMPGLLEGPELAQEVARLEGLPVEWKTLDGDDLNAYQNADLTLTRDPAHWHPYNPNAERDARERFENPQHDIEI